MYKTRIWRFYYFARERRKKEARLQQETQQRRLKEMQRRIDEELLVAAEERQEIERDRQELLMRMSTLENERTQCEIKIDELEDREESIMLFAKNEWLYRRDWFESEEGRLWFKTAKTRLDSLYDNVADEYERLRRLQWSYHNAVNKLRVLDIELHQHDQMTQTRRRERSLLLQP